MSWNILDNAFPFFQYYLVKEKKVFIFICKVQEYIWCIAFSALFVSP